MTQNSLEHKQILCKFFYERGSDASSELREQEALEKEGEEEAVYSAADKAKAFYHQEEGGDHK